MFSLKNKQAKNNAVVPITVAGDSEDSGDIDKDQTFFELIKLVGLKEYIIASNTVLHMYYAPPVEIRERCKNTWGTMGVVSALLAGVSIVPPLTAQGTVGLDAGTDAWSKSPWLLALLYVSFMAFMCNIVVIIASTVFYIMIDHIFTDQYLMDFLRDWVVLLAALPVTFSLSVLLVVGEILVLIGYTCHSRNLLIIVGVAAGICAALVALTLGVLGWTGSRCANMHYRQLYGPRWTQRVRQQQGGSGRQEV